MAAVPLAGQQERSPRKHEVELTFSAGFFVPTGPAGEGGGFSLNRRSTWNGTVLFAAYAKSGRWGAEASAGYAPERVSQSGMGPAVPT